MKTPSIKKLSAVFDNPKGAKQIFKASRFDLVATAAGSRFIEICNGRAELSQLRMHCLNAVDSGLYGVEYVRSVSGEYAEYLNTGDTYAPTVIFWRDCYRVQSLGDFIETQERNGVKFQ